MAGYRWCYRHHSLPGKRTVKDISKKYKGGVNDHFAFFDDWTAEQCNKKTFLKRKVYILNRK